MGKGVVVEEARGETTLNARLNSPFAVMGLARSNMDRARACRARHLPENHRTSRGGDKLSRKAMQDWGKEKRDAQWCRK